MKRLRPWLRVLGNDRRELLYSVGIALLGYLLFPIRPTENDGPSFAAQNTLQAAKQFVAAFIALLLAINAYRDKKNEPGERLAILGWCLLLCLWMWIAQTEGFTWWNRVNPPLTAPWPGGF